MSDAKVGTKITKEEQESLDPKQVGGTMLPQAQADVEGQARVRTRVMCPWCGAILIIYTDPDVYLYFTCCVCGRVFKA